MGGQGELSPAEEVEVGKIIFTSLFAAELKLGQEKYSFSFPRLPESQEPIKTKYFRWTNHETPEYAARLEREREAFGVHVARAFERVK